VRSFSPRFGSEMCGLKHRITLRNSSAAEPREHELVITGMTWRTAAIFMCGLIACLARASGAASTQLLEHAVANWLGERDRWAFTQRAVEYSDGTAHQRLERFDPSRPGNQRWQLLAVDGHPPTAEEREKWAAKKFKRHPRRIDTPIGDFFDFEAARVVAETPQLVRYEVPLRKDKNWLFPTDKVGVRVTVNKQTKALEHLSAHVREPFKVLLGLAHVMGGEVDLDFLNFSPGDDAPTGAQPLGTARVSVTKLGERVEFTWSDFTRVNPARGSVGDNQRSQNGRSELLTGAP